MKLFGISITLFLALVGELYRWNGILLLDIWVPIFAGAWLLHALINKQFKATPIIVFPAAFFIFFGFASLLLNSGDMGLGELVRSGAFGLRWASMFTLAVLVYKEPDKDKKMILWMVITFAVLFSMAGFVQLQIQPDFTDLEILGWDPHQGRLLSTWFDPNFVGGFLAFVLAVMTGMGLDKKTPQPFLMLSAGIIFIALILTFSRSAYLALLVSILILGMLRSWKFLALVGISLVLLISIIQPIQTRVLSLTDSIGSVLTENYTLPDDSARLRLESWQEGWDLFMKKPILGHGYNRYDQATLELGTLNRFEDHSATGSDSSLLTILATTGLVGFFFFLSVYALLAKAAYLRLKNGASAGLLAGLAGLFIHSIFVNSLLFPLFMAPFWILAGTVLVSVIPAKKT